MASVVAAPPPPQPPPPPPPPLSPAPMTSRRVPLGALPNAANSNHHGTTAPPAKRPRSQSISQQREGNYIEKPVVKKQYVEISPTAPSPLQPTPRTPVRNRIDTKAMPPRRGTNRIRNVGGSPPPFNPILRSQQQPQRRTGVESNTAMTGEVRARNSTSVINANTTAANNAAAVAENMEKIRAWQAHYRKVFPTFVFYFESFPEESVAKYQKQVHGLGAVSVSIRSHLIGI